MAVKIPMKTLEGLIRVVKKSRDKMRMALSGGRSVTMQPEREQVIWRINAANFDDRNP